eukprot:jgi/Tetstr1/427921/TSEL_017996.t1
MGVGEDPVGEDGMDIDAPAWPPADVEAADEGVIRKGDPGDFYMKVIAKKFRGVVEAMAAAQEHPPVDAEVAPAGYAKDLLQRVDGEELQAVRTGASCLLLSGDQMVEQMGIIGQIEEDLAKSVLDGDEDGELSPTARRAFNTTRLAEAKQNTGCHGVCQEDRRQALALIPSNFGRGLRPSFAVSKKSKGKVTVQSGWVMEDCLHHTKTFSLLTAGPLLEEALVKAIMTEKELASPAVGGANARRPGQRGANARRPGQRGANARRPGQRGANAGGIGGAAVATE